MKERSRTRWDLGRFLKTLNYFAVIPFIGTLPKWSISGNSDRQIDDRERRMGVILIWGALGATGQQVIERLSAKNYRVRAIVQETDLAHEREILGTNVELVPAAESDRDFHQVTGAIFCFDSPNSDGNRRQLENFLALFRRSSHPQDKILFDFTKPDENIREIWGAVDDVVMGGASESNFRSVRSKAIFSGNVSIANNGGFASIRTRNFNPPMDLSDYEGIELRVAGDGKRYKFIIRCEGKWDGLSYCYSFDTIYNFPQTIQIPFQDLIPVFRAKTVSDAGEFDASRVYSMQLMQSKFEYDGALNPRFSPGLFGLEIESIKAYGAEQTTSSLIFASTIPDLATESIVRNSGFKYTMIYYSPQTPVGRVSELCVQALENPELSDRTIEI